MAWAPAKCAVLVVLLSAGPAWAEDVVRVSIDHYRFEPREVSIRTGTTVEWVNDEKRTSHSLLFEGEPESDRLFPGESFRKTFGRPGRFSYRCGPHAEMTGVVEVVP
ncbi:MAG: plastocyanin/azurin family copper-binding protein [Solirubrobacterales bacterium]